MMISETEKIKYENELIELLVERITCANNSFQFQHLWGFLQQLSFEIRNAFGTTKSELIKFLRAHPEIFVINKGCVSLVSSSKPEELENYYPEQTAMTKSKMHLPPNINKGEGIISKVFPDYGIIRALSPKETYVYFTPMEYAPAKNKLLTDLDLNQQTRVFFNAIIGSYDLEVAYQATKVWDIMDMDTCNSHACRNKMKAKNTSRLIDRNDILPSSNNILRHRNNTREPDENVKTQQLASPPSKLNHGSLSQSETNEASRKKLENQKGRLYFNNKNRIIKFGSNYSEIAAADTSIFFLNGWYARDVEFEFINGDEVCFDAVAVNRKPSWKATLVWVGQKPDDANINNVEQNYNADHQVPDDSSEFLKKSKLNNFDLEDEKKIDNSSGYSDNENNIKNSTEEIKTPQYENSATKELNGQFSHCKKDESIKKELKNQEGKLYFYTKNPFVKFGKKYSEIATCASCAYFSDGKLIKSDQVAWEFAEGDDIFFDAVKTKAGWEAALVWTGKNPNLKNIDNNEKKIDKSYSNQELCDISSSISALKSLNNENMITENTASDDLIEKRGFVSKREQEIPEQRDSKKKHKSKSSNDKARKNEYSENNNREIYQKQLFGPNENLDSSYDREFINSRETFSDMKNNQLDSGDVKHWEKTSSFGIVEREFCSQNEINDGKGATNINCIDNCNDDMKYTASIKRYEAMSGKITQVYCKGAIVKCPELEDNDFDFNSSVFYKGSKPVDEQEIHDLKEFIKVGDSVKLNLYEIVDDLGDKYYRVTMAWKGKKPLEMPVEETAEDFIANVGLSVTISNQFNNEYNHECGTRQNFQNQHVNDASCDLQIESVMNIISHNVKTTSDDINIELIKDNAINNLKSESTLPLNIVLEEKLFEKSSRNENECLPKSFDWKLLTQKIIGKLKNADLITYDDEDAAHAVIGSVLEKANIKKYESPSFNLEVSTDSCSSNSQVLCTVCGNSNNLPRKMTIDSETQTICTGEVVAKSIYPLC